MALLPACNPAALRPWGRADVRETSADTQAVVSRARRFAGPHVPAAKLAAAAAAANKPFARQTGEYAAMVYFRTAFTEAPCRDGMPEEFRLPAGSFGAAVHRRGSRPAASARPARQTAPAAASFCGSDSGGFPPEIWLRIVAFFGGPQADCGEDRGPHAVAECDAAAAALAALAQASAPLQRISGTPGLWQQLARTRWQTLKALTALTQGTSQAQAGCVVPVHIRQLPDPAAPPRHWGPAAWRWLAAAERSMRCLRCRRGRVCPVLYGFPGQPLLAHAERGHCSFGSDQMQESAGFCQWRCFDCGFASVEYPWL